MLYNRFDPNQKVFDAVVLIGWMQSIRIQAEAH